MAIACKCVENQPWISTKSLDIRLKEKNDNGMIAQKSSLNMLKYNAKK